jgi:hypothetical protein
MSDEGIREALNTAVDAIFDVGMELERRGWGPYLRSDASRHAGTIEDFRDELMKFFKRERAAAELLARDRAIEEVSRTGEAEWPDDLPFQDADDAIMDAEEDA